MTIRLRYIGDGAWIPGVPASDYDAPDAATADELVSSGLYERAGDRAATPTARPRRSPRRQPNASPTPAPDEAPADESTPAEAEEASSTPPGGE